MSTVTRRSIIKQLACSPLLAFSIGCDLEQKPPLKPIAQRLERTLVSHRLEPQPAETQLAEAADWLWSQQDADGGWHSEQYALLKSGQAYTPFVLHTLLNVPRSICAPPPHGVEQALAFLRKHVSQQGVLGLADPDILEYPNYATSYALRCFVEAGTGEDRALIKRMRDYLIDQQYRAENGFGPKHLAHGGWGFGGVLRNGSPGHMDLAHTRRVLEALRSSGRIPKDTTQRAQTFLALVQRDPEDPRKQPTLQEDIYRAWLNTIRIAVGKKYTIPFDGGFYFSPIVLGANKGREKLSVAGSYFCSYASATCDGILSLLATGAGRQDRRIQAAVDWLQKHPQIHYPAGVPQEHPEPWGEAIHFYHLSVRGEVSSRLDLPGTWRMDIVRELAARQAIDGSYQNKMSPLMKEDDRLLATTLAVQALKHVAR
jgi:squalene-hopene/tetraprenyl-beta-curcumene cyclase